MAPADRAVPGEVEDGASSGPAGPHRVLDPTLQPTADTVAAFWAKVVKTPTCWYFTGAISSPDGYGP